MISEAGLARIKRVKGNNIGRDCVCKTSLLFFYMSVFIFLQIFGKEDPFLKKKLNFPYIDT